MGRWNWISHQMIASYPREIIMHFYQCPNIRYIYLVKHVPGVVQAVSGSSSEFRHDGRGTISVYLALCARVHHDAYVTVMDAIHWTPYLAPHKNLRNMSIVLLYVDLTCLFHHLWRNNVVYSPIFITDTGPLYACPNLMEQPWRTWVYVTKQINPTTLE